MSCAPPVDIVRRPRLWRPDDYWVRTGMISRATAIAETAEALLGGLYVYSPRQRQMVLHRPLSPDQINANIDAWIAD